MGLSMKKYQVSLDVVTSLSSIDSELAELFGLPPSTFTSKRIRGGILWKYKTSPGHSGALADRIHQLASEVRTRRAPQPASGVRKVSLGIEVLYDTMTCTVLLPLYRLVYGPGSLVESIPDLSTIELTCRRSNEDLAPSDDEGRPADDPDLTEEEACKLFEEWKTVGRPAAPNARSPLVIDHSQTRSGHKGNNRIVGRDTNRYIVSLNAITSASATASQVADVLGLPPDALTTRSTRRGDSALWRCDVGADETVGLADRVSFLASAVHLRRSFRPGGKVKDIYLDIGVIYDANKTGACSVSLPVSCLQSLVQKLFVLHVDVACYPGGGG